MALFEKCNKGIVMDVSELEIAEPTVRSRMVAAITRRYPFKSGCGTLASHSVTKWLTGVSDRNVWAKVEGGFAVAPFNDLVGRAMFFVGDLDPKVSWIVDEYVKEGDTVLDIGANLGLVSIRLADRVGKTGQVHSFEPNPAMLQRLYQVRSRNDFSQLNIHAVALGNEESILPLHVPRSNAGSGSLLNAMADQSDYTVDVPVRRLSDFAKELKMNRIDFIKIDVEGFEADVFAGGEELLKETRPRAILFEEQGANPGQIPPSIDRLQSIGYKIYGIPKSLVSTKLEAFDGVNCADYNDYLAIFSQ